MGSQPIRIQLGKILREILAMSAIFGTFFAIFRPLTGNKTSPNYSFLVEEVLSFDLVGHM